MTKLRKIIFLIFLVTTMLGACTPFSPLESLTGVVETTAAAQETNVPALTDTPIQTKPTLPASEGPFLLLQTAVDAYSIINFADLSITPFYPPGPAQQYNLAENLSPSGTQMLFPVSVGETVVYSFITESIQTTFHLDSETSRFQPDQAAAAAREALPGLKYSDEALLTAVKNAFQQSLGSIQWFKSDRYKLTVLPADETSNQLTLDDHQTGTRTALEDQPALVEAFWIGPDEQKILLKKGFMFEPGVWQDDRYYVVNVRERQAAPILLPEDADNPRVFWVSSGKLGIIHQPALAGGVGFSIVDVDTSLRELILPGQFDNLRLLGEGILTLHHDRDSDRTTLILWDLDGQLIQTRDVAGLCYFSANLSGGRLVMNCGLESVLVDLHEARLAVTPFREALFLLVPSPDGGWYIQVTQSSYTTLLDKSLKEIETLRLEAPPLEVRWLPDSSGFLYRTPRNLHLYQITAQTNTFLLESDLFGDYRNLNAVWIQLEQ